MPRQRRRAHPRSRGENPDRSASQTPPAWLIPAHAGKTTGRAACRSVRWAHPRSRGENHRRRSRDRRGVGLIPAHVGKTRTRTSVDRHGGAHPRSRGENRLIESRQNCCAGSSPLTRGKLNALRRVGADDGLIPAHAGKTSSCSTTCRRRKAHPRSRGENVIAERRLDPAQGSSPLTRGKPDLPKVPTLFFGLIPAHAGKTG